MDPFWREKQKKTGLSVENSNLLQSESGVSLCRKKQ